MKAEFKHLSHYLPYELGFKNNENDFELTVNALTDESEIFNHGNGHFKIEECIPIMHPLENLVKEIEFEGKKIRPMFEILKMASKHDVIPSETIEYSINEKAYFVRVDYRGFYVILAYDDEDKSFRMIRNDKIVSVANQLEMFEMLFKWHFNVYGVESINK